MYALVTGGGGFLGAAIVRQLAARGDRVRSFGREAYPELERLGVEVVRGDVRDAAAVESACRGVECVFHAAALAGVGIDRRPYEEINVRGTANVLAGCLRQGVVRLVHTSSPSVTFAGDDQCGVDERAPLATEWLRKNGAWYSWSKALAEEFVLSRGRGGGDSNLRACALRPHLIWGPGDNHLIPRLIARARAKRLIRVGDGANLVDICYVDNAAQAHVAAADALADPRSPVAGRAYFLSQGEPVNCWQWIDQILGLVNLPPVRRSMRHWHARWAGRVLEFLSGAADAEPPMTRFLAAQLAKSHWFDISEARRDLGYAPSVSTDEGMRRLGQWLRSLA